VCLHLSIRIRFHKVKGMVGGYQKLRSISGYGVLCSSLQIAWENSKAMLVCPQKYCISTSSNPASYLTQYRSCLSLSSYMDRPW
jgi:hypothetical protein